MATRAGMSTYYFHRIFKTDGAGAVVFSGSVDGHLRAYSTKEGPIVSDFDTAKEFRTVNGIIARGGSIDVGGPAIANGIVLMTSGHGL
ncbi:MAG: hypothetical protein DMF84_26685 [Acidobacteria bacterium]|nr:MAG: hypothetical protein DMF84_26685 [Acidobacteriota bacterium]